MFQHRLTHYALLLAAMAVLTFPNLGSHHFWDVDEGVNAEASREMLESGTLITPIFNFELRTAKPIMIYWLQMASYSVFGVNEFAARFPSLLAGLLTVLIVYELARNMFGPLTGLLAGIVLSSAIEFCLLSQSATTDSALLAFTSLSFYFFWIGSRDGRRTWFIPCAIASGLAVLTKGPVGLVLPYATIFLYLFWNRELKRLIDRRLVWGAVAFTLVAAPWYVLVALETKGVWIKQFIGQENVARFLEPQENHRGPIFFHLGSILLLFAPWSVFLFVAIRNAVVETRTKAEESNDTGDCRRACRFLVCWLAMYFVFFSVAATKLPNYILPAFPPLAILTARYLERWRTGAISQPSWWMYGIVVCFGCVGLIAGVGLVIVGGMFMIPLPDVKMTYFPGIERWLWIGAIPVAGAVAAWVYLRRDRKNWLVGSLAVSSVAFLALLASFPVTQFDDYKAPRHLVDQAGLAQPNRDIRLYALQWFQPSVVYYSRREVERLHNWQQISDCLSMRHPVYLFVPEPVWNKLQEDQPDARNYRTVARHFDYLKNCHILVVTNQS